MRKKYILILLLLFCSSFITLKPMFLRNDSGQNLYFVLYLDYSNESPPQTYGELLSRKNQFNPTLVEKWNYTLSKHDPSDTFEIIENYFQDANFRNIVGIPKPRIGLAFQDIHPGEPKKNAPLKVISFSDQLSDQNVILRVISDENKPTFSVQFIVEKQEVKKKSTHQSSQRKLKKLKIASLLSSTIPQSPSTSKKKKISPPKKMSSPREKIIIDSPRAPKQNRDSPSPVARRSTSPALTPVSFYNDGSTTLTLTLLEIVQKKEALLLTKTVEPNEQAAIPASFFSVFSSSNNNNNNNSSNNYDVQLSCWYDENEKLNTSLQHFQHKQLVVIQKSNNTNIPHIPCVPMINRSKSLPSNKTKKEAI